MKICTVGMRRLGVPPNADRQVINSAFLSVPGSRMWPLVHRSGINFCLIEKLGENPNWVTWELGKPTHPAKYWQDNDHQHMRCQEREFDCILCVPPRQGCKKGTGGYNQISFIAKTTVNFRKRTLFPKPAVMIIPSLYSQVRSKQLQLKWHTGNSRLSLLVAPVQADNRA